MVRCNNSRYVNQHCQRRRLACEGTYLCVAHSVPLFPLSRDFQVQVGPVDLSHRQVAHHHLLGYARSYQGAGKPIALIPSGRTYLHLRGSPVREPSHGRQCPGSPYIPDLTFSAEFVTARPVALTSCPTPAVVLQALNSVVTPDRRTRLRRTIAMLFLIENSVEFLSIDVTLQVELISNINRSGVTTH